MEALAPLAAIGIGFLIACGIVLAVVCALFVRWAWRKCGVGLNRIASHCRFGR